MPPGRAPSVGAIRTQQRRDIPPAIKDATDPDVSVRHHERHDDPFFEIGQPQTRADVVARLRPVGKQSEGLAKRADATQLPGGDVRAAIGVADVGIEGGKVAFGGRAKNDPKRYAARPFDRR